MKVDDKRAVQPRSTSNWIRILDGYPRTINEGWKEQKLGRTGADVANAGGLQDLLLVCNFEDGTGELTSVIFLKEMGELDTGELDTAEEVRAMAERSIPSYEYPSAESCIAGKPVTEHLPSPLRACFLNCLALASSSSDKLPLELLSILGFNLSS
jgi:hypothetical protein